MSNGDERLPEGPRLASKSQDADTADGSVSRKLRHCQALLIVTGSMGAGKTTVMAEASDILRLQGIHHAAIDYDALGMGYLAAAERDLSGRNLRSVWENYRQSGATRLLLARALETSADLEECCNAVSAASVVVCRLTAGINTMQERVRLREPGILQEQFVKRVEELSAILDRARLEHFSVYNEGRSVTEVAREMLDRAGWLQALTPQYWRS